MEAWKEEEVSGAAGKTFNFARLPERWKPSMAQKPDGGGLADTPLDILEAEEENYGSLWGAAGQAPSEEERKAPMILNKNARLYRPTVKQVKKACGKF